MSHPQTQEASLTDSLEDYLEAIYHIVAENRVARPKDISARLRVKSSSVTGALHALAGKELVNYQPYGYVTLTDSGQDMAKRVVRRHRVVRDFLVKVLGVDSEEADEVACRMEHAVRGETLEKLVRFLEFLDRCPRAKGPWLEGLAEYCERGVDLTRCETCLKECLQQVRKETGNKG